MDNDLNDKIGREAGYAFAVCCMDCKHLINFAYGRSKGDCKKLSVDSYIDKDGISWNGYFKISTYGLCKYFEKG